MVSDTTLIVQAMVVIILLLILIVVLVVIIIVVVAVEEEGAHRSCKYRRRCFGAVPVASSDRWVSMIRLVLLSTIFYPELNS